MCLKLIRMLQNEWPQKLTIAIQQLFFFLKNYLIKTQTRKESRIQQLEISAKSKPIEYEQELTSNERKQ